MNVIPYIRQLVECESPSDSPADLKRFMELFADSVHEDAVCRKSGTHLICTFKLPGRRKQGQIMALGHGDTVWPLGTLRTMPFREAQGRLWGPGVLDMKAGLAFFVFAMRELRESDVAIPYNVMLQINSDEEVGSLASRALTEANAARSKTVLVLEPGTGLDRQAEDLPQRDRRLPPAGARCRFACGRGFREGRKRGT